MKQLDIHQQQNNWRICVILLPDFKKDNPITTYISTFNLLEPLARDVFVIIGNFPEKVIHSNKIHIINIGIRQNENIMRSSFLVRAPLFILLQLEMSYNLIKIANKIDVVFLAAGAQALFLVALAAKLLRKKIVLMHLGIGALSRKDYKVLYSKKSFGSIGNRIYPLLTEFMERLVGRLSDRIVVFLPEHASTLFRKNENKVFFDSSRFYVDINSFKVEKHLDSRKNVIGCIGRLIEEKGIRNFVKAIPLIMIASTDIEILIGGDGPLKDEIGKEINHSNLNGKVTLTGWIPHNELSQYLNEIKLLVMPSYGETGPHIIFEAMACGTPVLATPVGIVPAVIKDGETGFIMENNSPECIAENIIRALNHPNLNQIAKSARELIEKEYTHEAAVERYRHVLASLR